MLAKRSLKSRIRRPFGRVDRSRSARRPFIVGLALYLQACVPVTVRPCEDTRASELLRLINAVRADSGLAPLRSDLRLITAARAHSVDMAENDFFDHSSLDGSVPGDRAAREGYEWSFVSENIGAGQRAPAAVLAAWMESPGHRANILTPEAEHIGIAYIYREESLYRHYWTAAFAATRRARHPPRCGP